MDSGTFEAVTVLEFDHGHAYCDEADTFDEAQAHDDLQPTVTVLVPRSTSFAMFEPICIADRFVAHPRHGSVYGCGSLRAVGARNRFSA